MNKIVQVRIYDVTTDTDNLHKKQMKKNETKAMNAKVSCQGL